MLILFVSNNFFAQSKSGNITGNIYQNGKATDGALILLENVENKSSVSHENGFFELINIPYGSYTLLIQHINSKPLRQQIQINQPTQNLTIQLEAIDSELDAVVIETESEGEQIKNSALKVETVEIETIATEVKDLNQAIDQLAGVRVRTSGSLGDRTDVNLNGLSGTAVRTYIDGLPLEFMYPSMNIGNIPMTAIQRVDIYKGVLPVNVGTDALGGGINLITQAKDYNYLKAGYGYGSFNTHLANIDGNFVINDKVILNANVTKNHSDNNFKMRNIEIFGASNSEKFQEVERFHDEYSLFFSELSASLKKSKWADTFKIGASYGNYNNEVNNGNLIQPIAIGKAFYEGNILSSRLNYKKYIGQDLELSTALSYSKSNSIFVDTTEVKYNWKGEIIPGSRRANSSEYARRQSNSDRNDYGLINRTSAKYFITENDIFTVSNVFTRQLTNGRDVAILDPKKDPLTRDQVLEKNILGAQYTRKLFSENLTTNIAGKLYTFKLGGQDGNGQGNSIRIGKRGEEFGFSSSIKYKISDAFTARGSFEKALRIPTAYQFFGDGKTVLSNLGLKTETSDNFNLGVAYQANELKENKQLKAEINAFLRGQENIIFLAPGLIQRFANAEEVSSRGIELDMYTRVSPSFSFNANVTKLSKTFEDILDPRAKIFIGTPFPNTPDFFFNVRSNYTHQSNQNNKNKFGGYVQYKFVDEFNIQNQLNDKEQRNNDNWVPIQNKLDAGVHYSIQNELFKFSFNVNNVLNENLFDNYKIPRPLRNYNFRINYQINHKK